MAATRLIAMHKGKGRSLVKSLIAKINYAENSEKTDNGQLISSYACNVETAAEEFLLAHAEYEKKARRKYEHQVIAYQIRQSFKSGEISPEEANRIGYETAMRFTKGNHAFIVATHVDRAHVHNHVIYCSVNLDNTKKFKDFFRSGLALQRVSDIICLEHGMSVIKPRPYSEREKRTVFPKRNAFRDQIKEAIDIALSKSPKNFDEFLSEVSAQGYEIKHGKHTAVRGKNQKCFIRFRSLGDGYSEEDLIKKIEGVARGKSENAKSEYSDNKRSENTSKRSISKFEYSENNFDMLLDLQKIINEGKGKGYEIWAKKFNLKNLMKALVFFQEKGLRSYKELSEKAENSSKEFSRLSDKIKKIESRMKEISDLRSCIINYSKTREVYINYRKSGYSRKFFEEHKKEIQIHKAAKAAFDKMKDKKIPKVKELNEEFQALLSKKRKLYEDYRNARKDMQLYQIAKYDIEQILKIENEDMQQNQKKQKEEER